MDHSREGIPNSAGDRRIVVPWMHASIALRLDWLMALFIYIYIYGFGLASMRGRRLSRR